ncbi:MAG: right-handed parallel beta-helix repeat-containing protein, partial [Bryobacterales bacterium]|nr:right-handed parallel beta-helix repeat-containing protein [Bryobacterales bacterium]
AHGVCPPSPQSSACLQAALDRLAPGEALHLDAGEYGLDRPLQLTRPGVSLEGAGEETLLYRAVSTANGEGVINLRGSHQSLSRFRLDGRVTEPKRIPYSDNPDGASVFGAPIYGDPMHADLVANTSITIHRGVAGARIEKVTITHTGGYAILIDARYGDIRDVVIRECRLQNNRPYLFGAAPTGERKADLRFGAWTGGIHYQNDGRKLDFARFAVRGLTVEDCVFERIAGHAVWGHGYGFETMNEDIMVRRNRFEDIGLDAIQIGNATRGVVEANSMHRIGFVTETDDDRPRPAWYPGIRADMADNIPAVGIDTTGLVRDSRYNGNTMMSVNGTGIDLDGFTEGKVTRNEIRIPGVEDAYGATLDRIAEFGPYATGETTPPGNLTKGINLSNSSATVATRHVYIAENRLINLGGYAMLLLDCQESVVERNEIRHYSTLNGPIVLANTLREPRRQHVSSRNIVRDNRIYFPWHASCVTEGDNIGAGELPVEGPNYVYGNTCNAMWGELTTGRQSHSVNGPPPARPE